VLDASSFQPLLMEDADWASENIPLFEASSSMLTEIYYFRWRTYKRHIKQVNRTDGINFVVTEFAPNVSWAGEYNTINCAAGHHMMEGRWLRDHDVIDSYSKWWVSGEARTNYYYWYAHALRERLAVTGDIALITSVLPQYIEQFRLYTAGHLPSNAHHSTFSVDNDCAWNRPGNEGQVG
jgi:hypothetical protein